MLNILLIDADQENIKNFRTYIKGSFADLKIVGSLSDQRQDVFTVIKNTRPELIVADIRFFGSYGYQSVREIYEKHPDIRFILYGALQDNEYLIKCREYGTLDTMFRPIKPADLTRCLHTAIVHFKQAAIQKTEDRLTEESYYEQMNLFRNIFLCSLVRGAIRNEKEIKFSFEYFRMGFSKGYTVIILRIDHYKKIALTLSDKEKHMLIYKIMRLAKESFKSYVNETFFMELNAAAVLLGGREELDKLAAICEEFKSNIYKKMRFRVTVGIGRTYEDVNDIFISYKEAESALRYRFHVGYNTRIFVSVYKCSS